MSSLLPFCLSKIDRVSFGLLTPSDLRRALARDPRMPRSRRLLAVPFVGKDVPSAASEFESYTVGAELAHGRAASRLGLD